MEKNELTHVSDIQEVQKEVKKHALTKAQLQFMEAATEIIENPDHPEAAYLARQLVLCTLPHTDPGDVPIFTRQCGNVALTLVPYIDRKTGKSIGCPFGVSGTHRRGSATSMRPRRRESSPPRPSSMTPRGPSRATRRLSSIPMR